MPAHIEIRSAYRFSNLRRDRWTWRDKDSIGRDWKHQVAAKNLYHDADRFMAINSLIHQ